MLPIEVLFVELKHALNTVYAQVHRDKNGHHEEHRHPDTQQAFQSHSFSPVGFSYLDGKYPSVEDRVEHDEQNTQGCRNGRSRPCLSKVAFAPYVQNRGDVYDDQKDNDWILEPRVIGVRDVLNQGSLIMLRQACLINQSFTVFRLRLELRIIANVMFLFHSVSSVSVCVSIGF